MKAFFHRKVVWCALAVCAIAVLAIPFLRKKQEDSGVNVPLGVEQAAIVTFSGPPIAVTPYKWGVAVNARIGKVTEQAGGGARIYDVRYIVNREGTFDLKDYLTAEDGSALSGLPSFKFHGDPKLSKHLDARIQETEEIRIDVGGHYYATLAVLGALWVVWLLLLIFYGRAKPAAAPEPAPMAPTFAELLRAFLAQLESGTFDAEAKAKMEMLLIRQWREEAAIGDASMSSALEKIGRDEKTGRALRDLQLWLHHPASKIRDEEIAAVLAPFAKSALGSQEVARA